VFAGAGGGVLRAGQWRACHWHPAVRAAGLEPLRPHDLRHTAVALWIAAGANPKQIATRTGHTSVSVVLDRCGDLFEGHEAVVPNRPDAFMASAHVPTGGDAAAGFRGFFAGCARLTTLAGSRRTSLTCSGCVGAEGLEPPASAL
jgi:hypothetical protein